MLFKQHNNISICVLTIQISCSLASTCEISRPPVQPALPVSHAEITLRRRSPYRRSHRWMKIVQSLMRSIVNGCRRDAIFHPALPTFISFAAVRRSFATTNPRAYLTISGDDSRNSLPTSRQHKRWIVIRRRTVTRSALPTNVTRDDRFRRLLDDILSRWRAKLTHGTPGNDSDAKLTSGETRNHEKYRAAISNRRYRAIIFPRTDWSAQRLS